MNLFASASDVQLDLWEHTAVPPADESGIVLSIRHSAKARHLILQAVPPRTVEVVVPRGTRAAHVEEFVREHRGWIDRAGAELIAAWPDAELKPAVLDLRATGERISLHHCTDAIAGSRLRGSELYLRGQGPDDWQRLLRRWLLRRGRDVLGPWLEREAARTGLAPRRFQIRLQRTRWGSCSARGSISLNAALLLVPHDLVRYLLVHELCHLQHLDHSRRYWRAVAQHEPQFRTLDRRLAACWRELPGWLLALV